MKKSFMFIGSLPTKKYYFDGERNKSRDVLNALKNKYGNSFSTINLSLNQYFQVAKMIILSAFLKYDFIFVSKCLVGGSKAINYLQKFANKNNKRKIIFYIIGNGSFGFDDKKIYYDATKQCNHIIVESPIVEEEFVSTHGIENNRISIFPCVKPDYSIPFLEKNYPVDTLKLLFFSRVTEAKGLMDAINAVIDINEANKKILFTLDIAGGSGFDKQEQDFLEKVKNIASKKEYINYLGLKLRIENEDSYKRIQSYDLHIFPSRYFQECAPGSVVDMFVAGIPTLSSDFPSSNFLMSKKDSFFFRMNDVNDLKKELMEIYNNQLILNKKRMESYNNGKLYSEKRFCEMIEKVLGKA